MLLPRILAPIRAATKASPSFVPSSRVLDTLRNVNSANSSPTLSFIRNATSLSQGRANGAKDGPGKRLGAKKTGGEYVIPGNIIFRQRGTTWFPGENCGMGRDHCIFAKQPGYVRYYRDPRKHPTRQYIGITFTKDETLPYPPNAPRRRRLGLVPVIRESVPELQTAEAGAETGLPAAPTNAAGSTLLVGKKGYAFREANWDIGRAAERAGVKVREFVPGDRFRAWRKSKARKEANAEKKRLRGATKAGKKPQKKRRGPGGR
ncbi:ribosomal protein L27 [Delitschia confertaspora ATCC 74209]|uniref:Large ribosomal subunit protein bL27m n=1 Tax=Delitschia confertaspora ATCC 74209 TaxID=1513339 RepID=A0A9P4JRE3_9PLEO|nr:ribosomal protein L27 [Delitschia confertaspora ATCC 74209]